MKNGNLPPFLGLANKKADGLLPWGGGVGAPALKHKTRRECNPPGSVID
jgi:hypothetical protein